MTEKIEIRTLVSVKLHDKEFTVKELTPREIINLFSMIQFDKKQNEKSEEENKAIEKIEEITGGNINQFKSFIDNLLSVAIAEEINFDQLMDYTPSNITRLYDAFQKANSHFFVVAQKINLGGMIQSLINQASKTFLEYVVV